MKFLSPTENPRINEPVGILLLAFAIALTLSFVSYHPLDPSSDVAGGPEKPQNLIGYPGAYFSNLLLQWLGLPALLLPVYLIVLGWVWVRSGELRAPLARITGALALLVLFSAALNLDPQPNPWLKTISSGGVLGLILADALVKFLNEPGAVLALVSAGVVSIYLLTSFHLRSGMAAMQWLKSGWARFREKLGLWRAGASRRAEQRKAGREERRRVKAEQRLAREQARLEKKAARGGDPEVKPLPSDYAPEYEAADGLPPIVGYDAGQDTESSGELEGVPLGIERLDLGEEPWREREQEETGIEDEEPPPEPIHYRVPPTNLLMPAPERAGYEAEELHTVARQICAKFQEFGVGGEVSRIHHGPVVTTYEFKPDPGIKYSKIINLSEDLCLALECESILVERIPGKATVGIEVPNRKRDIIALREGVESPDFREGKSHLTIALGKDVNGKLKVADLTNMPHLLIAGSTGSGKSVLINTLLMSVLLRATPQEVRFILVDPKTVELGLYHDIPHLLTPVITDMKKASNALKNATREMERRLKLLAEHSVRNIDQFNAKVERLKKKFKEENRELSEDLTPMPYIVIIIDELADLMMLEGRQIEESITRLAQMSRAAGIHLVLATQRPSVDVITGLIKANIPARISFRLATRVDSRTILDSMGAEVLLGKGDMLFLPPGSSRMVRLHGPLVTEEEIEAVVRAWKEQGRPRYETDYLQSPRDESDEGPDGGEDFNDPAYEDAVRIVLEMGKASTSTLQRRLRLGYGRAARILDAMERDGIIGPPDGSRPRDVLKRPEWLAEVEHR